MTSEELNKAIRALEGNESNDLAPDVLSDSGKQLPYYGWFWRDVDFDLPISMAYADGNGGDVPAWVGFCENNKWGYEEFTTSALEAAEIKRLCESYVAAPSRESCRAVYDYLQSIKPESVTGKQRWDGER